MTAKQIGIGESNVEGSETIRIKHLAEINPSKSEISDLPPETDVSFVPLEGFGTEGEIKTSEPKQLNDVYDGYTYFREGDIAIAKITPSFENGKGAICEGLENEIGFGTTELHIIRPHEGVNTRFLWYVLRTKRFMDGAKASMRGVAGQQRVPSEYLENYHIRDISEVEQRSIANFLDFRIRQSKSLIETGKELIESLDERRDSIIYDRIGEKLDEGIERNNGTLTPGDVKRPRVKHISQTITSGPRSWSQYYDEEGDGKFIRITNLQRDNIELSLNDLKYVDPPDDSEAERASVHAGDVLVSITADVGSVGVVPSGLGEAYVNQHIAVIRPSNTVQPKWLAYCLSSPRGQEQLLEPVRGGTKAGLGLNDIGNVRIPLLEKQKQLRVIGELENQTNKSNNLVSTLRSLIELSQEKRQALITKAVTGQIDLSDWQPPDEQEVLA